MDLSTELGEHESQITIISKLRLQKCLHIMTHMLYRVDGNMNT